MNATGHDLVTYPHSAGYADGDTSKKAAEKVDAKTLQRMVLNFMKGFEPMSADECAAFMHKSVLSIRPRFTELAKQGLIVDTGQRRRNASGRMAKVMAVTPEGRMQ